MQNGGMLNRGGDDVAPLGAKSQGHSTKRHVIGFRASAREYYFTGLGPNEVGHLRPGIFDGRTSLLSEPMARQGFDVLGIDASEKNIAIASTHAKDLGLPLTYHATSAEALTLEGSKFDLILNMEVVEHVADLPAFFAACGKLLAPGGMMIVATLNRTLKSLALAKIGAEYVLRWLPPGTHDWNRFVRPDELIAHLEAAGLSVSHLQGVAFDPMRWEWRLSSDTDVNYLAVAGHN